MSRKTNISFTDFFVVNTYLYFILFAYSLLKKVRIVYFINVVPIEKEKYFMVSSKYLVSTNCYSTGQSYKNVTELVRQD